MVLQEYPGNSSKFNPSIHKYIHQPGESFHSRLNTLVSLVETPFCAWLCDDEFQLPSGLIRGIQLFESHPKLFRYWFHNWFQMHWYWNPIITCL